MDAELLSNFHVIIVPGLHNSGPGHWQTRWQAAFPDFVRVQQDDWDHPQLDAWVQRLDELRDSDPRPALLVAHSFGCLTSVTSIARNPDHVAGALLVAPAHPDRFGITRVLPSDFLPCPTTVISSSNDPWMPAPLAASYARAW
ncbi:MAG: RBBP9/YdeN family alpha/beta hydrolase, partial [Gammaproteobacteria bacterium]